MTGDATFVGGIAKVLRRGIVMAERDGRTRAADLCRDALVALECRDGERLASLLLEIGNVWCERRVFYQLVRANRLEDAPRQAGKRKAGKTKGDPAAVKARYQELSRQGLPRKGIIGMICQEHRIAEKTARNYLR